MSDHIAHLRQPSSGVSDYPDQAHSSRQRSFRLEVFIGIILVAVGVLGAFWLRQAGNSTTHVLGVVRDLPAGHTISDADLFTVEVDQDVQNQFVEANLQPTVVGSVLTSAVSAGPVARAALQKSEQILGEGEALMATAMEDGTFPPSLTPGDVVAIVVTPSTSSLEGEVSLLPNTAVVFAVAPADEFNTKTVVTLRTSQDIVEQIAASGPVHLSILKVGGAQ